MRSSSRGPRCGRRSRCARGSGARILVAPIHAKYDSTLVNSARRCAKSRAGLRGWNEFVGARLVGVLGADEMSSRDERVRGLRASGDRRADADCVELRERERRRAPRSWAPTRGSRGRVVPPKRCAGARWRRPGTESRDSNDAAAASCPSTISVRRAAGRRAPARARARACAPRRRATTRACASGPSRRRRAVRRTR